MDNPLVSVIIPVYNVEKYLRQCLDSVINQTLKDIEIICVDDGSTDNSLNILKEYKEKDNRIIILQQQNQYAGVARNNGLKIAKGKYLSFLDSDDWFDLNMLKEMVDRAEKDQSDIVICGWYNYNNKTKQITSHLSNTTKTVFNPIEIKTSLFTISYPNPWTKLFKKTLFTNNNLYFESIKRCNDLTCVYTAFSLANKISVIKKPYVYYRSNQTNNLSANKNIDCFIQSINRLYENLNKFNRYNLYKETFKERLFNSLKKELSSYDKNDILYTSIKNQFNDNLLSEIQIELNKIFNVSSKKRSSHKNKYF